MLRQIGGFLFLFIHALGSTAGTVSANLLGEHREGEISGVVRRGFLLSVGLTGLTVIAFSVAPRAVISIFTDLPEVVNAELGPYWMLLLSFVPGVPGMYLNFVLASVGRTKAAATVSGCSVVTYVAYIAWLTTEASTLTQYWFSDTVYYTTAGIVATVFYLRSPWRRKG